MNDSLRVGLADPGSRLRGRCDDLVEALMRLAQEDIEADRVRLVERRRLSVRNLSLNSRFDDEGISGRRRP